MTKIGSEIEKQVGDFLGDKPSEELVNSFEIDEEIFEGDIRNPPEEEEEEDQGSNATSDNTSDDDSSDDSDDDDSDDNNDSDVNDSIDDNDNDSDQNDSDSDDANSDSNPELVSLKAQLLEQDRQLKELLAKVNKTDEEPVATKIKEEVSTFVTDEDIDEVLGDAKKFNELMNKAISSAVKQAIGHVSEAIPGTVSGVAYPKLLEFS